MIKRINHSRFFDLTCIMYPAGIDYWSTVVSVNQFRRSEQKTMAHIKDTILCKIRLMKRLFNIRKVARALMNGWT